MSLILQITDPHLQEDPQKRYRAHDADRGFHRALGVARRMGADLLVLTGDLSDAGGAASYTRMAEMLEAAGIPWLVLPGNHDRRETMDAVLGRACDRLAEIAGWQLLLLDSVVEERPGGRLAEAELTRLEDLDPDRPALVFLHHQPLACGSPWIDKFGLDQAGVFIDRVRSRDCVRAVAWGHIHQVYRKRAFDRLWLGSPSAVANSLPHRPRFTLDPRGGGCRWFRLQGEELATGIVWQQPPP